MYIKVEPRTQSSGVAVTRSADTPIILEKGKSDLSQRTFINNATKNWNLIPENVKNSASYHCAKKKLKTFSKTPAM